MSVNISMAKGVVYKLSAKNADVSFVYIGSTTNFNKRMAFHKFHCSSRSTKLYSYICDNGGWCEWQNEILESIEFNDRIELNQRERHWCEQFPNRLNKNIPGRTKKEWVDDNVDSLKQKSKQYYIDNKEKINAANRKWYSENKEKAKQWRADNADKLKAWYEANNQKIVCDCGAVIRKSNKAVHLTTKKHNTYIANQIASHSSQLEVLAI